MGYIIAVILGYLLGCSSMAYYLAKWNKADLQSSQTLQKLQLRKESE